MNRLIPSLVLLLAHCATVHAEEAKPLLNRPGKTITEPDFEEPLGKEWSIAKGTWSPANGTLTAREVPEDKHSAVLHLATGPTPLILECEFRFRGAKVFYVGCDGARHVGRLVITPKNARLAEDSTEVKGKTPSHVLAEAALDLKQDEWQRLRVEFAGDKMSARLNGVELQAQHPYLATPKVRWWFAVGGASVELRKVRVAEGLPL